MNDIIQEDLKRLPEKPGVYIMRNAENTVLYVGKARVLKKSTRFFVYNLRLSARNAAA